jgi:hypothetical protein
LDKNNAFYIQVRQAIEGDVYLEKMLKFAQPTVTNYYDGIIVYQFALSRADVPSPNGNAVDPNKEDVSDQIAEYISDYMEGYR